MDEICIGREQNYPEPAFPIQLGLVLDASTTIPMSYKLDNLFAFV
jgi:hypothetical protein